LRDLDRVAVLQALEERGNNELKIARDEQCANSNCTRKTRAQQRSTFQEIGENASCSIEADVALRAGAVIRRARVRNRGGVRSRVCDRGHSNLMRSDS